MGGADCLSRVLDTYSCQRKSLKWYRKIAELFLDVSIYNWVWKGIGTGLQLRLERDWATGGEAREWVIN